MEYVPSPEVFHAIQRILQEKKEEKELAQFETKYANYLKPM